MTCVDCHGVKMQGENGEFTSHGFSESPLENPEALEYCLTCHSSQGVKDAEAMKEFVAAAQKKMADAEEAFGAERDQLQGLIMAAKDAEGVDADASPRRRRTSQGRLVRALCRRRRRLPRHEIAHNPKGEVCYCRASPRC